MHTRKGEQTVPRIPSFPRKPKTNPTPQPVEPMKFEPEPPVTDTVGQTDETKAPEPAEVELTPSVEDTDETQDTDY